MAGNGTRASKIKFEKLGTVLKSQGKAWRFLSENGISTNILAKMKKAEGDVSTRTIERVCELLHCQPGDIMEYREGETKDE